MQGIAQRVMADPGKYSIQQLQQAMQNGTLPAYIAIPIIQDKVQQQKQAQQAAMLAQPSSQGLPSIAQQVMSEAQGVEGLRSNLPTQYAQGGIVAFADGGDVERYQVGGATPYETPYDRMNRLNRERGLQFGQMVSDVAPSDPQAVADRAAMMNTLRKVGAAGMDIATLPGRAVLGAFESGVTRPLRALGLPIPYLPASVYGGNRESMTPYFDRLRSEAESQQPDKTPAAAPVPNSPAAAASAATPRPPAVPGINMNVSRVPGMGIQAPSPLGMPQGPSYESIAKGYLGRAAAEAESRDVETEQKITAERDKVKGQAFEEYKKNLEDEAKQSGAERQDAKNMALFKAGLAMMAGTSRHALENIGKGAMVGVEDYQGAVKDLKKAEKERQKQFALIEQARRSEQLGDRDKAIDELKQSRDRKERRDYYTAEAVSKGAGMDKSQAYDLAKTQFNADSDIFRTDLAGRYSVLAHDVSGQYSLAAARERAAGSLGLTPSFMLRAMSKIDENAIAASVLKEMNLKKAPPPTDKAAYTLFQNRLNAAYQNELSKIVGRATGMGMGTPGGAANPFAGFKMAPDED